MPMRLMNSRSPVSIDCEGQFVSAEKKATPNRKEVNLMKYEKPLIRVGRNAQAHVLGTKGFLPMFDNCIPFLIQDAMAYEVDE